MRFLAMWTLYRGQSRRPRSGALPGNVRATHLCPDSPVLHHWPQLDTKHTNAHVQTHAGVVRSLVTDVCLCMSKSTCAHVCCVSILNGPSQRCQNGSVNTKCLCQVSEAFVVCRLNHRCVPVADTN